MGSGAFGIPILERIARSDKLCLIGAATQPDKAAGRKRLLTPTPLGKWADEHEISCERVVNVNDDAFLERIEALKPDMIVVVSFGQILKEPLLKSSPLGCFNVHASLLPKHRGASPVRSAILSGDKHMGVSFMQMEKGLDTGPVYQMFGIDVAPFINAEEIENELANLASEKIEDCICGIADGKLTPEPQDHQRATMSHKIHKDDGAVDWSEDAAMLERKVRAYHKWPTMSFLVPVKAKNKIIFAKITAAGSTSWQPASGPVPGKFISYMNNKMMVSCGHGSLIIERILPEGKKEMAIADFLNGHQLRIGDIMLNGPKGPGK